MVYGFRFKQEILLTLKALCDYKQQFYSVKEIRKALIRNLELDNKYNKSKNFTNRVRSALKDLKQHNYIEMSLRTNSKNINLLIFKYNYDDE